MRKAICWIGILTGMYMVMQSFMHFASASNVPGSYAESYGSGAAVCFLMGFVLIVAAVIVLHWPMAAVILDTLSTIVLFRIGDTTVYIWAPVWSIAALVLAVLSFIAWRQSRVTPSATRDGGG